MIFTYEFFREGAPPKVTYLEFECYSNSTFTLRPLCTILCCFFHVLLYRGDATLDTGLWAASIFAIYIIRLSYAGVSMLPV
jgi:hypothetical protein